MSATRGPKHQKPNGQYMTSPGLAEFVVEHLRDFYHNDPRTVLDPCCGTGNFIRAAQKVFPKANVRGYEIAQELIPPDLRQVISLRDALLFDFNNPARFDLIVGNPPFGKAEEFVTKYRQKLTISGHLAFILRLGFLSGQRRFEHFWGLNVPEDVWVFPARPSFSGGGTDSEEYCLIVWPSDEAIMEHGAPTLWWIDNRSVKS